MDSNTSYLKLNEVVRQRNLFAALLVFLAIVACAQAFIVLFRNERVVLVPTLQAETTLESRDPSAGYLEQAMRDVSTLFLNRHPHNLAYFRDNILRLAHPSAHGDIAAAIRGIEQRLMATKSSTVFYPIEIYADPRKRYTEIRGVMHTFLGPKRVKEERKIYAAEWAYRGMRLSLLSFFEVDRDDSEGQIASFSDQRALDP